MEAVWHSCNADCTEDNTISCYNRYANCIHAGYDVAVILVTVWFGAPFFMVMYLASLKSVPEELYEAASIDGATWWQRMRYVTFPMMRNVIAITMIYSLISTFAGFTIVSMLTSGGPLWATQVLGTSAFFTGILGGNLPMGASVSLFMVPILAVAATFILRGIAKRGNEA